MSEGGSFEDSAPGSAGRQASPEVLRKPFYPLLTQALHSSISIGGLFQAYALPQQRTNH